MKKIYLFITTIIFIISIVSCGSNSDKKNEKENKDKIVNQNDSSDITTATPYQIKDGETFQLVYKFSPGYLFRYRLITTTRREQNIFSDTTINDNYEQKVTRIINFNTLSVDHDTIANIKCTITDIDVYLNINGRIITYKSGQDMDSIKQNQFIEFETLVNNPFNFKVSTHGNILDVFNDDGITKKFIHLSKNQKPIGDEEKSYYQQQIRDILLKPMLAQIMREFPDNELKVGGNWEKNIPAAQVMSFKLRYLNKYNLENIEKINEDKIAAITGTSDVSVEGDTKQFNNGIEYSFQKPVASVEGKIYFNIDKGLLYKSNIGSKLELKYDMQMQGPDGLKKANSTQSITSNNTAELL